MVEKHQRGRLVAAIGDPGGDAGDQMRKMRSEHGDEGVQAVYDPRRSQYILLPKDIAERLAEKNRVKQILTGE